MKGDAMRHIFLHRPQARPKPYKPKSHQSKLSASEPKYRTNMCRNTTLKRSASTEVGTPSKQMLDNSKSAANAENAAAPSILARYTCASILMGFFAVWGKYTFVPEAEQPGVHVPMHSYKVPLALTVGYLISLPVLRYVVENFVSKKTDMKVLLTESMVLVRCCVSYILVPDALCPILIIGKVQLLELAMRLNMQNWRITHLLSYFLLLTFSPSIVYHLSLTTVQRCASIPQWLDGLPIHRCRA